MPQLVGTNCVQCQGRITNELDAGFCPTCAQGSHFACRRSSPNVEGHCPTCGGSFDAAAKAKLATEQQVAAAAAKAIPLNIAATLREARRLYRLFGFLIPAGFLIVLGILFMFVPDMRDDPKRISVDDVVRGGVVMLAGATIAFLAGWMYWNSRKRGTNMKDAGLTGEAIKTLIGDDSGS